MDIFSRREHHQKQETCITVPLVSDNYFDEREVRLSVTWKFGNKGIKSKRERNSTLDEKSKRM